MYTYFIPSLRRCHPSVVRNLSSISRVDVHVNAGTVRGTIEKLPDGKDFHAFRGIPYAKAPLGDRRFLEPEPLANFDTPVLDCSVERDICISRNIFDKKFYGSENCLHLNVYVPRVTSSEERLPVMVFIHGGSFRNGSGNSDCYSPEYLLEQNVIVVTMNYRLGPLGLLHLPSQRVEGNASMKDQLMALRWVAENISNFNGDPNNVTLFGESSGGISVHMHLLSPISTQYFHKAICQSGVALAGFAVPNDTIGNSRQLARLINSTVRTDAAVLETVRNAPAKDLMELSELTATPDELRQGMEVPFRPVVDRNSNESIFPLHPITAMQKIDHIPPIPLMLGYNNREGATFLRHISKYNEAEPNCKQPMIPSTVHLDHSSPEAERLTAEVKKFYFGPSGFSSRKQMECADLLTDLHYALNSWITAELHARFQHRSPLYFYRFEYDGMLNLYKKLHSAPIAGAYHADELCYLFRMKMFPQEVPAASTEARVRRYMCRMWTNFARYGNPTPANDESLPFRWNPVPHIEPDSPTRCHLPYLSISAEPEMDIDPDKDRMEFWEKVYKKYNGAFSKL